MLMANDWGDVELDARGMRALAHPVRLAILERLHACGPDTATGLAEHVSASPSVLSWHLRHLAEHGLVEDAPGDGHGRKRWWRAVGRGFRFSGSQDPAAYRLLSQAVESAEADLVPRWYDEVLPTLDDEWAAASGRANTTIVATVAELAAIEAEIERLLTPYVQRKQPGTDVPAGARRVRLLRYAMPEAASGSDADD
jgi:DNA-binding transcriptional ArsR family regulator